MPPGEYKLRIESVLHPQIYVLQKGVKWSALGERKHKQKNIPVGAGNHVDEEETRSDYLGTYRYTKDTWTPIYMAVFQSVYSESAYIYKV